MLVFMDNQLRAAIRQHVGDLRFLLPRAQHHRDETKICGSEECQHELDGGCPSSSATRSPGCRPTSLKPAASCTEVCATSRHVIRLVAIRSMPRHPGFSRRHRPPSSRCSRGGRFRNVGHHTVAEAGFRIAWRARDIVTSPSCFLPDLSVSGCEIGTPFDHKLPIEQRAGMIQIGL